jgi:hypothetical protein
MPARCLTLARPLEHARLKTVGTIQGAGVLDKAQGYLVHANGEVALSEELVLRNRACHRPSRTPETEGGSSVGYGYREGAVGV